MIKKKLIGIKALARLVATFPNSLILTLAGIALSGGYFGLKALLIFIANWLNFIFIYAINDVEDAEDDAQDPKKVKRNPISNGTLSKKEGYIVTFVFLVASIALYAFISWYTSNYTVLAVGIVCLLTGFLYSWKPVRLKSIPILDVISHAFMLAGGMFLTTYYAYRTDLYGPALIIFIASYFASLRGDLENEIRDFDVDKKTNIKNTVQLINNIKIARIIQTIVVIITIGSFVWGMLAMSLSIDYYLWFAISTVILIAFCYLLTKLGILKKNYTENIELIIQLTAVITVVVYIITLH